MYTSRTTEVYFSRLVFTVPSVSLYSNTILQGEILSILYNFLRVLLKLRWKELQRKKGKKYKLFGLFVLEKYLPLSYTNWGQWLSMLWRWAGGGQWALSAGISPNQPQRKDQASPAQIQKVLRYPSRSYQRTSWR